MDLTFNKLKFKIDLHGYAYNEFYASTGKIQFLHDDAVFPAYKSDKSYLLDQIIIHWLKGLIQLYKMREEGLYYFTFDDEEHDWVIDFKSNTENLVIQFLKNKNQVLHSSISLIDLKQLISFEVERFLKKCSDNQWVNEELSSIRKLLEQLNNLS